jgi:hypothetical protein
MATFQADGGIKANTLEPNAVATLVNAYTTHTAKMQIGSSSNTGSGTNVGICVAPLVTSTSRTISIGKTTVDSVHVANVEHIGPAIGNATASLSGDFDICTAQTTGILNIGTGVRTGTGAINIGTNATTSATIIGNNTATANTLELRSGSAGITLATNSSTGINIKSKTVDVDGSGTLSLGITTATNVDIGKTATGTTTINNALTATGLTTANGGLTMGTGKNITLQPSTGYVAPSSTQLGYVYSGSAIAAATWTTGTRVQFSNISLTESGTYIITANVFLTFTSFVGTSIDLRISTDNTGTAANTIGSSYNTTPQSYASGEINITVTGIYQNTSASTVIYFGGVSAFSSGTLSSRASSAYPEYLKAVRIA